MGKKNNIKAWLYLLPALILMVVFMLYPLIDVFIMSFKNNYIFYTGEYSSIGFQSYKTVLTDPNFITALKNTFIIVLITVPLSTIIALLLAVGLNSIKPLKKFFETVFFLPYVTNTLAVGLVFLIIFDKTDYSQGLINVILGWFNIGPVDFIGAGSSYFTRMFVLCLYIIWIVMPFKVIVLISALQSVDKTLYQAAKIDKASRLTTFKDITLPMISPTVSYLVITGFIGAFKEFSNVVALHGNVSDLINDDMITIVGYVYYHIYGDGVGGMISLSAAAAIILFFIVLTITVINLLVSKKNVHY